MSTTTTESTTRHVVDLWQRETILRRQQIVIEVPSDLDAFRLAALDGEELSYWADEHDANWEIEDWDVVYETDVSGPVPDGVQPEIVLRMNKFGDLIEAESGNPAAFVD